jgi:sugar transferase (PEP-CTERM/EpsH1 system associated)
LRAFNFIKRFSCDHELDLISFIAKETEREWVAPLCEYCRRVEVIRLNARRSALTVLANLWRGDPLQALYYRSRAMRTAVDQRLFEGDFDAIYVHLFRMAPYVANWPEAYRIVDLTDVISQEVLRSLSYRTLAWRSIYRIEHPRIARYECQVARDFDETWLISDADRRVLARECPGANIRVVTNGVDTDQFQPTGQVCEPNSLIFVGHLRVQHNVDAVLHLVRDVLPRVRQQIPECTLAVVGADPAPQVRRLAREPGLRVTGFVPDLNRHLNRAAVFVAPLRFAAGVQNKVLEAMAAGRPVVTTSLVNQGVGAEAGRDLLVADDAEGMADKITALLRDADARDRLGQAGRAYVRQHYRWGIAQERMRQIEDLVKAGKTERMQ